MERPAILTVNRVTMRFNLEEEKIDTLKERVIRRLSGKLRFTPFYALRDVSFTVRQGEAVALVGVNGSGKSTLLKLIAGVLSPTEGTVEVDGSVAPLIELGAGFDYQLTGRENIYLSGAILGCGRTYMDAHFREIMDFAQLWDFADVPLKNYSSGMVARLGFSIATMVPAEILLVDEVLSVGDAAFQRRCAQKMQEMLAKGSTLLFVSHDAHQVRQLCSRAIWLDKGCVMADGAVEEVIEQYEAAQDGNNHE